MKFRVCTVVTGSTLKEFLVNLAKIQKLSEWVELRVDYIQNIQPEDIKKIRSIVKKKSIFTCRKKQEGGQFTGSEKERINILHEACRQGFDYVDIELSSIKNFDNSKHRKSKIIISFHDFYKTPPLKKLEQIKKKMLSYKPNIMKFAVMSNASTDNNVLLKLLVNKKGHEKMIVLGMGEKGKITRILSPILGGYLTFASTKYSQSAPGQIDIDELKYIYAKLKIK